MRSPGPGKGSQFIVTLPLREQAPAAESAPVGTASPVSSRARRVLVVDDNRDAAESLAMILSIGGAEVAVALSGPQALQQIPYFRPTVVLMDIGMPGMDGYEVAQRIRAEPAHRDLMLVALTGWGQAEDKERAMNVGFDHHLTKPVDPAELESVLEGR